MTHRYYDPAAGRFLTRDPIGYAGGINLYAYTGNDPVNRADPSGLAQFNVVPGPWSPAAPDHMFITVNCPGAKGPNFGFYPNGPDGAFNPLPSQPPGIIHMGDDPDGPGGDAYRGSMPTASNGDPNFGHALCRCINESAKNPPHYYIPVSFCYTWATDMWDCARQAVGKPTLFPVSAPPTYNLYPYQPAF